MSKHLCRWHRVMCRPSSGWESLLKSKSQEHHKNYKSNQDSSGPDQELRGLAKKSQRNLLRRNFISHLPKGQNKLKTCSQVPFCMEAAWCIWPPQMPAVYFVKLPAHHVHVKSHCKMNHTLPGLSSVFLLHTDWSRTKGLSSSPWWRSRTIQA